jgi:hypothetical protein
MTPSDDSLFTTLLIVVAACCASVAVHLVLMSESTIRGECYCEDGDVTDGIAVVGITKPMTEPRGDR